MNSQRRVDRLLYVLCFFMVGNFCRSYHVNSNNNFYRRARSRVASEKSAEADRRTFFANMGISLTLLGSSPSMANAIDVVLPGEMKPQEPKNRRIGGLAAKIRTVGNIMVSTLNHVTTKSRDL